MVRGFNDHAANERTFLAWVRAGLLAMALGIVVKMSSFLAVAVAAAASPRLNLRLVGGIDIHEMQ